MAKVVVKSKVKKVKRKFPVEVKAPESFDSVSLGTSKTTDLVKFVGKTLKVNLMYVTKSVKNQNVRMTFRVSDVSSGVAKTEVVSYEQIPYYLNRFIKSGADLITDSFVCETKDGKKIRIKPFVITKKNTNVNVLGAIRNRIREVVAKDVQSMSAEEYVVAVTNARVQMNYRNEIKKVFPLKAFEFKKVLIE